METDLFLSRTAYRAGSPIVGTVRIRLTDTTNASKSSPIRSKITSARLYLTGQAHLHPASSPWRSSKEISKLKSLYGEHACLTFASSEERRHTGEEKELTLIEQADRIALHLRMQNQREFRSELPLNNLHEEEDVICFWMTNVLDLMKVAENGGGDELYLAKSSTDSCNNGPKKNRYMLPRKPLRLPDYGVLCQIFNASQEDMLNRTLDGEIHSLEPSDDDTDTEQNKSTIDATNDSLSVWEKIMSSANTESGSTIEQLDTQEPLNQSQIAITFRSNLPEDVPPSMSAECVKYFYSVVVVVTTADGIIIKDCPFTVLTRTSSNTINHSQSNHPSSTRVHIGELHGMAHSSSLSSHLSPMEALGDRQLHVLTDPPACSIVSRVTAERRTSTHRIQNENGALCAWLTLVGVGGPIVPGTRLGIVVRFPQLDESDEVGIIPCHRVCCALVGEEYALCEGAVVSASSSGVLSNKRKTRSYVFDSTFELVEFGCTNSISMGLLLPSDCPVTVKTDLVEVTICLKLEFTVDRVAIVQMEEEIDQGTNSSVEASDSLGFGVIRLELPVTIVHDDEMADEEEEEDTLALQTQLVAMSRFWNDGITLSDKNCACIDDVNVCNDLKVLSLKMLT